VLRIRNELKYNNLWLVSLGVEEAVKRAFSFPRPEAPKEGGRGLEDVQTPKGTKPDVKAASPLYIHAVSFARPGFERECGIVKLFRIKE